MKAYVVSFIEVNSPEIYAEYAARAPETVAAYGGRYLARNGLKHQLEGLIPNKRVVLMEFDTVEQAKAWHSSPDYQKIIGVRHSASTGQMFVIEGIEPSVET